METFYWSTEEYHPSNSHTMDDYISNHLEDDFTVIFQDGSYAEIQNNYSKIIWGVQARGNGDSFNHMVEFEFIH